jgi:hypothetical protein
MSVAKKFAVTVGALIFALRAIGADQPPPPVLPPGLAFKNLQVLPKNITPGQLVLTMHGYATGLGVDCNFCHVPIKLPPGKAVPPGGPDLDYALDDLPTKRTARQMIVMLRAISAMTSAAVGKPPEKTVSIQCFNCHRGMTKPPLPLADLLDHTTAEKGLPAAIAQYRDLRSKYFGSGVYDFGDATSALPGSSGLESYAFALGLAGKPDDGLAWLKVNLEYYPKSAPSWALIGMTQALGKHDKVGGLKSLQKAIALDSHNPVLQGFLQQVQTLPP